MANYLLVYHGGSMPNSPEAGAKIMQAWTDWFGVLGEALAKGCPVLQGGASVEVAETFAVM